ncbi:RNA 2'-phosphotransferase [Metasolibacillus meyeri]|uniref:RNA 2'-phosphotransferase n=1 Tax=Metasolibacillus meyeri TaxID=1071052 RepID=A0AAW9NXQ3_9BACL|nr:RNA 2'-phosphotransferase [Metasolibacillus meyeri]MEC1179590.1 RNA 2'-phosphotransferase [Metasolibacillus meyeri]
MAVSTGFYKKIKAWVTDDDARLAFRPFQVDGNPYKSSIFVVGAFAAPKIESDTTDERVYIDALVNGLLFDEMYGYEMKRKSREYFGMTYFMEWLQQELDEHAIATYINTLQIQGAQELKRVHKEAPDLYKRGQVIFQEVVEEFQPRFIVLQGTEAVQQFRANFAAQLTDYYSKVSKVQELEELGIFAELNCKSGNTVKVLACRSMSYYGKEGKAFQAFKDKLQAIFNATGK